MDVRFTTLCTPGTSSAGVESYATHEVDGEEPGPSAWPIVIDTAAVDGYGRYCGAGYQLVVVGRDGLVAYDKITNLMSPSQRQELVAAIDAALLPP